MQNVLKGVTLILVILSSLKKIPLKKNYGRVTGEALQGSVAAFPGFAQVLPESEALPGFGTVSPGTGLNDFKAVFRAFTSLQPLGTLQILETLRTLPKIYIGRVMPNL